MRRTLLPSAEIEERIERLLAAEALRAGATQRPGSARLPPPLRAGVGQSDNLVDFDRGEWAATPAPAVVPSGSRLRELAAVAGTGVK